MPTRGQVASRLRWKEWGYGEGYQHAHKFENAIPDMACLPPSLAGRQYYFPTGHGIEKRLRERLEDVRKLRGAAESPR